MSAEGEGRLALWGGLECTVVRLRDRYRDQFVETGHRMRVEDLDAVAALGIRTLRYPAIWETIAPRDPAERDFSWHDERLARLEALGIEPILGLVHHGAGPRYTNLLDPAFPDLLADFAEAVARRYPQVSLWTPVNEPLTTARFSALYGHWHPHRADEASFLMAVAVQCRGVLLAMRAIRRATPHARLVQTEDLGKTFAAPELAYQADYENERRWLSFDLLCGRVDAAHPFAERLRAAGVPQAWLDDFRRGDGAPDVLGINHYLTSERWLDPRLERYPPALHGGNAFARYADVEAVRIDRLGEDEVGPKARLAEAWARYRIPLAVTEAHHGCTREEQLRWLDEVWRAALALREEGADVRAVTIWSMYGAVDWNSLLVRRVGFYEPGAFDIRGPEPRPTALAAAAAELARDGAMRHPVLDAAGWWRRAGRQYHGDRSGARGAPRTPAPRRLLVAGATGTLGRALSRIADHRGLDHVLTRRDELDLTDEASIEAALDRARPWAAINAAGFVRVADAEREEAACLAANAEGAALLAAACARRGVPFVTFSSDLVFDGRSARSYVESDPVSPTGAYGRSKAQAERLVAEAHPGALIVRASAFFGPWDRYNFAYGVLADLAAGRRVAAADDVVVSPTYVPDLVHATLDLLIDGEGGVWHLANQGALSWRAFAERVARAAGLKARIGAAEPGPRPLSTALGSERGLLLPPLESAVARYVAACEVDWRGARAAAAE